MKLHTMEQTDGIVKVLLTQVEEYGKTSFELTKLKAVQKLIPVATAFTGNLFVLLALYLFIFMLNIGIAMWLGELLGKPYLGFIYVSAFYLLTGIILHFTATKFLRNPVGRFIIKQTLNPDKS
ncbi:hypothetical protein WG954_20360 [Lacibacter sp. H375]|uniref:hypothetical protein n=1 Tax=Lacibacter sp. H375 TaxID=3133424 RepID=UPI0030BB5BAA